MKKPTSLDPVTGSVGSDSDDGPAILPKKKSNNSNRKPASPVMQVMQAVAKAAQNPGKKKKDRIPSGPSKANKKTPQKSARVDSSDGPSAEKTGKA